MKLWALNGVNCFIQVAFKTDLTVIVTQKSCSYKEVIVVGKWSLMEVKLY